MVTSLKIHDTSSRKTASALVSRYPGPFRCTLVELKWILGTLLGCRIWAADPTPDQLLVAVQDRERFTYPRQAALEDARL